MQEIGRAQFPVTNENHPGHAPGGILQIAVSVGKRGEGTRYRKLSCKDYTFYIGEQFLSDPNASDAIMSFVETFSRVYRPAVADRLCVEVSLLAPSTDITVVGCSFGLALMVAMLQYSPGSKMAFTGFVQALGEDIDDLDELLELRISSVECVRQKSWECRQDGLTLVCSVDNAKDAETRLFVRPFETLGEVILFLRQQGIQGVFDEGKKGKISMLALHGSE